ncbi:UNKNOWN [Stylonychia lemnae]|uniref:Uncharacterized protein n=1 Tax=Stylonychia lemnae TaxID=5949 RepID=A0A078ASB5_STYLE|nr:UNKNOWN [Stylonychia lemnae]|eukprot:CDW84117.1 UNKNOWN [Stylonychia lemnae]
MNSKAVPQNQRLQQPAKRAPSANQNNKNPSQTQQRKTNLKSDAAQDAKIEGNMNAWTNSSIDNQSEENQMKNYKGNDYTQNQKEEQNSKYDFNYLMSIVNKENQNSQFNPVMKIQQNEYQNETQARIMPTSNKIKTQQEQNYKRSGQNTNINNQSCTSDIIKAKFQSFADEEEDDEIDSNNGIDYEVKKISTAEEELMKRARDLENEMRQIRQAKLDVVVKQFEAQLLKDGELEEKRYTEELRDKYELQVNQIEAEKQSSMDDIQKMQKQLLDQIEFFKVVYSELESKKSELSSTHQACIQYLRREMSQAQQIQKERLMKHINEKKEIFKNYVQQQQQY